VDNDASQFPESLLRAWKTVAEHRASSSIGKTPPLIAETESQKKLRAILPWKGKCITLAQMSTGKAVTLIGPVRGYSAVLLLDCNEFFITIGNNDSSMSISLANIAVSFDNAANRLELQERYD
jgi:predicted O-methyltransferase YrrM